MANMANNEMLVKAEQFLHDTNTFYDWCKFMTDQFYYWIGKQEWLHSDRCSATYDWVNDGRFKDKEVPEGIIECLVELWETKCLHIKFY